MSQLNIIAREGTSRGGQVITCADGFSLSIGASRGHYCTPRSNTGRPYVSVEVGYPSGPVPAEWQKYAATGSSDIYGWVPVETVRALIDSHGGESPVTDTAGPDAAAEWRAAQIAGGRRFVAALSDERRQDMEEVLGKDPDLLGPELAEAFGLTLGPPKPLTLADIPGGQGAASLHIHVDSTGVRSLRFKDADGTVRGVPYGAALDPDAPEREALWELFDATLLTIIDDTEERD